jgi:hypothetical protein
MPLPELTFASVFLPLLLAVITLGFFILSSRQPRLSLQRSVCIFLALNALTLACCTAADYLLAQYLPERVLKISPLIMTALYLVVGGLGKIPLVWGVALVTPGLWFCAQSINKFFFNLSFVSAALPQDPAWFLLVAVSLVVLMHVAKMQNFWDALEQPEVTAAFCYGMGGFWLLSLGESTIFALFSLPLYVWVIALFALAAFGLWLAKLLGDAVLSACCGLGIVAGLYSIGVYVFAPAA